MHEISFDPDTNRILTAAFEAAWTKIAGGRDLGPNTDMMRNELAKAIIGLARTGERDPDLLRTAAIVSLGWTRLAQLGEPQNRRKLAKSP